MHEPNASRSTKIKYNFHVQARMRTTLYNKQIMLSLGNGFSAIKKPSIQAKFVKISNVTFNFDAVRRSSCVSTYELSCQLPRLFCHALSRCRALGIHLHTNRRASGKRCAFWGFHQHVPTDRGLLSEHFNFRTGTGIYILSLSNLFRHRINPSQYLITKIAQPRRRHTMPWEHWASK